MHRRHALTAFSLGSIAAVVACRDSFALAPTGDQQPDLQKSPNTDAALPGDVQDHFVTGGGGCRLHVIETGNAKGQPILFLHGFSQNALTWSAQFSSGLRRRYRLVAMDLRGHGASDRPTSGYDDSQLWADDIDAVIRELSLDQPVLCGWSYCLVMLDYIRHYGDAQIGGLHFVDGIAKLGSAAALAVITPEMLALVPAFFSTDAETSVSALQSLVHLCFAHQPSAADFYTMLGFNVSVPPFVRQGLFNRTVDNDDVLTAIRKPVLITHGALDAVVKIDVVEQIHALVPQAKIRILPNAGHAPFRDDTSAFNQRLSAFADAVRRVSATSGG